MVEQVREALRIQVNLIEEKQSHESLLEDEAIWEEQEALDAAHGTSWPPDGAPAESKPETKIQRLQASQTRKALETVVMLETQVQVSI